MASHRVSPNHPPASPGLRIEDPAEIGPYLTDEVVPLAAKIVRGIADGLGLESVRPWDYNRNNLLDPQGRAPLAPFQTGAQLETLAEGITIDGVRYGAIDANLRGVDAGDKVTFAKIEVDQNPGAPRDYQVLSIPTLMLFQNGKPTTKLVGAKSKSAILKELDGLV